MLQPRKKLPAPTATLGAHCALAALLVAATSGCFNNSRSDDNSIRVTGSDTMVNLAQAWAEAYQKDHPEISCQVRGGGSGVGIAALINGKVDIAPASRAMSEEEMKLAEEKTGQKPQQFIVGRDALAIYVHKGNPLDEVTVEQLAEVYGQGGKINTWPELGVENPACPSGEIIRVSRQNNSGTYVYFREAVLGDDRQYKQGTTAQSGSSDVVDLVANTPCAIGYSGMGYHNPDKVKMVKVAAKEGAAAIEPSVESALDGTYPISRPLYIYTAGEPTGAVEQFIEWILGPEGQQIVEKVGYVPNATPPPAEATGQSDPLAKADAESAESDASEDTEGAQSEPPSGADEQAESDTDDGDKDGPQLQ